MSILWLFNTVFTVFNLCFIHYFKQENKYDKYKTYKGRIKLPLYVYILLFICIIISYTNVCVRILFCGLLIAMTISLWIYTFFDEETYKFKYCFPFKNFPFFSKIINFFNMKL